MVLGLPRVHLFSEGWSSVDFDCPPLNELGQRRNERRLEKGKGYPKNARELERTEGILLIRVSYRVSHTGRRINLNFFKNVSQKEVFAYFDQFYNTVVLKEGVRSGFHKEKKTVQI